MQLMIRRCFGLLLLGIAAGCGPADQVKVYPVKGTVKFQGQPMKGGGSIAFYPTGGQVGATPGGEIKEGKYTARVPVGTAKVEVRVPKVVGRKKIYDTPDSPIQDILAEVLPARYNDNTELTFDVKAGNNQKDFDLKGK